MARLIADLLVVPGALSADVIRGRQSNSMAVALSSGMARPGTVTRVRQVSGRRRWGIPWPVR